MTDMETRLRDAMHTATPEHFDTKGLAPGAHRYAVRARRLRVASTTLAAAVVIGVVGTASSGLFRDRATEPAVPKPSPTTSSINICPDLQKTITPLTSVPASPLSSHADAVLVCALIGGDSVWPGSLPPDDAVLKPATIDLLDWRLKGDASASQCGNRPKGDAFTVSYRDLQGASHTYLNSDLLCDGWVFLDSYYIALSEQGADYASHQPAQDPFPTCPSILPGLGESLAGKPVELPKGTVFRSAIACAHPVVDPGAVSADTIPRLLYVRRGVMGDRDLATLNANLARTGSRTVDPGCKETAPLNVTFVVRAVTSAGDQVSLTAPAACLPHFHVNDQRGVTITLEQATVDVITGPLNRFP
jgi:hypothetical protein